MKTSSYRSIAIACLLTTLINADIRPAHAQDELGAQAVGENAISYARQIEPIFRTNCQGCHQAAKAQGGFVMTDFSQLLEAGESGEKAIVPGDPEASYLVHQITLIDGEAQMPKKGKPLSPADVELIRQWIAEGAKDDSPPSPTRFDAEHPPEYVRPPVVTTIAYSPDGKWLATSGFQEVFLIDTGTLKTRTRLIGLSERIESVSFSPDSKRLAVTGGSPGRLGEVQVWDVEKGELLLSRQVTYDTVYGGCFSPDGKLVAFGCADNTVRAINSETGEQVLHQGAHDDWILACVFNPDGKHLVSAGRDMTVKLTEVETERFVDNITSITPGALAGGINSLAMHPERDEVLVGGADGVPKVYRLFRATARRIGDDANLIRQFPATAGRIFSVSVSKNGKLLAVSSTLDGKSQLLVYPYDFDGALPDDLKAALAKQVSERKPEEHKLIEDYRSKTSSAVASLEFEKNSLYAIAFSPDAAQIATGGSDGILRIVDVDSAAVVSAFSPADLLAAASGNNAAQVPLATGRGLPIQGLSLLAGSDEAAKLPRSKLVKLTVSPTQISLDTQADYAQLVVSAEYADGAVSDVTRLCKFESKDPCFSVSELGLVSPLLSGTSPLLVSFQGESVAVDVQVADLSKTRTSDFVRDVNPILSRAGCNAGTCHGAQKGKNGFKLSLRGYDPVDDVRALSDDLRSRRLNSAAPDSSVMLLKPTGAVPHEGGVVFTPNSVHYAIIRDWIEQGAALNRDSKKVASIEIFPTKPVIEREGAWQQFRVVAKYPDGKTRDVTQESFIETGDAEICKSYEGGRVQAIRRGEAPILARYEGAYAAATITVMGDRTGFAWTEPRSISSIDELVADKWERMKIEPSDLCEDHEFLRRIYLDLTGLPPTGEEVKTFLADKRPSRIKRQLKIDELIGSEEYVEHWANKWADLLQVNSKFLGSDGAKEFRNWIRQAVKEDKPYDEFARSILTAKGSNKDNPAASYYKILRDPDLIMENTTHLFMAVRFNCNKCHDHPFERWTQNQYYELAAFFAQTALKRDPASGDSKIGGTAVEGAKPLYEEVYDNTEGEMKHISTGQTVAPSFPFDCDFDAPENATRREVLSAWLTSADNPYFARSYVNRLWGYLTGTGLMEPLDDIRAGNPPTNPELLEHLTQEFIRSGFNAKHIIRLICNSRTYQLSVATNAWNKDDTLNYSHAKARRLPAEVLYDAVYHVTGAVSDLPGVAPGTRAAALPDVAVQLPDGFLNNLGRPVRESACECERSQGLQLGPVMALVSGPTIGKAISDPQCDLPKLADEGLTDEQLIREVYLRVLSREASEQEVAAVLATTGQISLDHEQLKQRIAELESWWKDERQRREEKRLLDLQSTQRRLAERKLEIAPERERLEQERIRKVAEAEETLKVYAEKSTELANKYLGENADQPNWFPLAPATLESDQKDTLIPQPDRSIVASGEAAKGTYTFTYRTPLDAIRGFRLEALPHAGIAGGGPGQAPNGNFVVTEIEVYAAPASKPDEAKRVAIASGKADFSQEGFAPEQVFDGKNTDQQGWAVSPRGGSVHWATFLFTEPVSVADDDLLLTFKVFQNHNADKHRLAHFRISVTTDDGELPVGLPEEFVALRTTSEANRTVESLTNLVSYLKTSDAEWLKLEKAVAEAKQPLPEDVQVVSLQNSIQMLEKETTDDPKLVQLRVDFAASQNQFVHQKLTLAQDLTWALINSPAFLFNH